MLGKIKAFILFLVFIVVAFYYSIKVLFRWGDLSLNQEFVVSFAKFANPFVGVELKLIDSHKVHLNRPCVFLGNHQSGMDFATMGLLAPKNVVIIGKKEIIWIPFFGWFLKGAGNILIDRKSGKKSHQALQKVVRELKAKNLCLAIMPEGTRNRKNSKILLPFKRGAFHVAIEGQFPLVPVLSTSLEGIAMWERGELKGGEVWVKVLDPIETLGKTKADLDSLIKEVHQMMQLELDRLHEQLALSAVNSSKNSSTGRQQS